MWRIFLVFIAACGSAEPPPGGVWVASIDARWQPAVERPWSAFGTFVLELLLGRLVRQDGAGGWVPSLASSLDRSEDGRRWTVTLRDGARFASGREITSEDVAASLAAQMPGPRTTIVDAHRLQIDLEAPRASFLVELGRVGIARKDQSDRAGPPLPYDVVDSSSAWTVVRVREPVVVLGRNPYTEPQPSLEGIVVRAAGDKTSVIMDLLAGEADDGSPDGSRGSDPVLEVPHLVSAGRGSDRKVGSIRYNCASPKLADARVRRALNLAVDREAIVPRFLERGSQPAGGLDGEPGRYDPAAAGRLLDEAGWRLGDDGVRQKDGMRLELEMLLPEFAIELGDAVQAAAEDLRRVGVPVTLQLASTAETQRRRAESAFELTWGNYTAPIAHPALGLLPPLRSSPAFGPYAGAWDYGRCGAATRPWVDAADGARDDAAINAAVRALYAAARADPPALFLYQIVGEATFPRRFVVRYQVSRLSVEPTWQQLAMTLVPDEALPRDRLSYWLR